MKKIISIILVILLVLPITAVADTDLPTEEASNAANHQKTYCTSTVEDDFEEYKILVSLTPEATEINRVYTPEELSQSIQTRIRF